MRLLKWGLIVALLAVGLVGGWAWQFTQTPLAPREMPFEFTVKPGATLKSLSKELAGAGVLDQPDALTWLGRFSEKTAIRAGNYRIEKPLTPAELLDKLVRGDVVPVSIQFIEGSTYAELRRALAAHKDVKQTLAGVTDAELLKRLGAEEAHPEGLFFPDTYFFAAGTTDFDVLKRAHQTLKQRLADAWAERDEALPYKSPYEALIMASIIEKETGRADERATISAVFINRTRIGMRLQTDPTVIYGIGPTFDGNIRKRDLTTDTPYNTYTRDGLPPTPIALPGWGSLIAAVKPAQSDKLYFVGKGDGSHHFSRSLEEHNRAVARYQLKR
ncbi:MAG: endolytic transglycosylase MltG [Betaproteobacteria bacterium]|nr:endolytic transglycosylase MltG [Betaproteobacteria bacterium]